MKKFDHNPYKAETLEKWGKTDAYREYDEKTKEYSRDKWQNVNDGLNTIFMDFALCKETYLSLFEELSKYEGPHFRKIHISSYVDKSKYNAVRQKIRLFQKLAEEFLSDATESLSSARLSHIEIESIYRPYLNIPALNSLIQTERI